MEIHDLPMPRRVIPPPPEGPEIEVILHLDEHHDWAPRDDGRVPTVVPFSWVPGLYDNRTAPPPVPGVPVGRPVQLARRNTNENCREMQPHGRHWDRDPDTDGGRQRTRLTWRSRLSCNALLEVRRGGAPSGNN